MATLPASKARSNLYNLIDEVSILCIIKNNIYCITKYYDIIKMRLA